jgi:hypothetical protein
VWSLSALGGEVPVRFRTAGLESDDKAHGR